MVLFSRVSRSTTQHSLQRCTVYSTMSVAPGTVFVSQSDLCSDDEGERDMRLLTTQLARSVSAARSSQSRHSNATPHWRGSSSSLRQLEGSGDEGEEEEDQTDGKGEEGDDDGEWRGPMACSGWIEPDAITESDKENLRLCLPSSDDVLASSPHTTHRTYVLSRGGRESQRSPSTASEPTSRRGTSRVLHHYHAPFGKLWDALAQRVTPTIRELEHVTRDRRAFAQSTVLGHAIWRTSSAQWKLQTLQAQLKVRWQELTQQLRPGDAVVVNLRDVLRQLAHDIITHRAPHNKQFIDMVETTLRDVLRQSNTVLSGPRRPPTPPPSTPPHHATPAALVTPSV